MKGLSLWLCPAGVEQAHLRRLILDLAHSIPGCLPFSPHLTLISDDQVPDLEPSEVLRRASEGVKQWRKAQPRAVAEVEFKDVRAGAHFYQCVLAATEEVPGLMSLNSTLRRTLPVPSNAAGYFPHVSLIYGELTPKQREEALASLKADGRVVKYSNGAEIAGIKKYVPVEIVMVLTKGLATPDWKILGRVSLKDGAIDETEGPA